ncbi:YdcF family protein [Azospirillum sp. sgz302134]
MLLLAVGVVLSFSRRRAALGRALVGVATFGFLVIAATPIPSLVALPLEERFERPNLPDRVDGVIMLGGAVDPRLSYERGEPSLNSAAERIFVFADLIRRYPQAKHVFTGGSGLLLDTELREDGPVRGALVQAGIDPDGVIFENESRNTWENAVYSQRLVQPKPGERWLLVTTAFHMPRSVGIFRRVGWDVTPYPVDYRTRKGGRPYLQFSLDENLSILHAAVREWIGLISYRLMGRTDSLFPAP